MVALQLAAMADEGIPIEIDNLPTPPKTLKGDFSFHHADIAASEKCRLQNEQLQIHRDALSKLEADLTKATALRDINLLKMMGVITSTFSLNRLSTGEFGMQLTTNEDLPLFCTTITQVAPDILLKSGRPPCQGKTILLIDGCSVLLWSHSRILEYLASTKRESATFTVANMPDLDATLVALRARQLAGSTAVANVQGSPKGYSWHQSNAVADFRLSLESRKAELESLDLNGRVDLQRELSALIDYANEIGMM